MRRFFLFLSIFTLAFMASCQNEELIDTPLPVKEKVEVSATLADASQSRTQHSSDFKKVLWSGNDAISVFSSAEKCHDKYYITNGVGTTSANFQWDKSFNGTITGGIEVEGSQQNFYVGVYPFMEGTSVKFSEGSYEINTVLPTNQNYAENSFGQGALLMVGVDLINPKPNFSFKNVGTILIFPLNGNATISSATLKSEKSKIAGKAVITVSEENNFIPTTTVEEGECEITLSCGEGVQLKGEEYTNFCFVLAPGVYDDLVVKFTDTYGNYFEQEIENPNGKEMARSMSYNMPKMTFEAQGTEEIDLWVKAKAGAYMTAERIIPSVNTLNVEEWVKNLMAQPDTKSRLEQAVTYITMKNYEGAFNVLGGIPGFERNYKDFAATGVFYQKVDYTGASYVTSMLKDIENIHDIPSLLQYLKDFESLYEASGIKNELDKSLGSIADNFDAYIDAYVNAMVKEPEQDLDPEAAFEAYRNKIKEQAEDSKESTEKFVNLIESINNTLKTSYLSDELPGLRTYIQDLTSLLQDIDDYTYNQYETLEQRIKNITPVQIDAQVINSGWGSKYLIAAVNGIAGYELVDSNGRMHYTMIPSDFLTGKEKDYFEGIKDQIAQNETLISAAKAAVRSAVEKIAGQSIVESLETAVNDPESTTAQVLNYLFAQETFMETVKTSLREIVAGIEEASKDSINGSNVTAKEAAISTAKTNALLYARANAGETILADLEAENYNNLNNGAWGIFKQVLTWEKTVEFFANNKMTDVYDVLVELGKVIDNMITYTRGSIYYDIEDFADYQENVDWWVVKFNEEFE